VDDVVGIARKEDILALCLDDKEFDLMHAVQEPIGMHEGASILDTLAMFKRAPVEMALVVDEGDRRRCGFRFGVVGCEHRCAAEGA
jgi:CBS domain containing-hemolysin-like protein